MATNPVEKTEQIDHDALFKRLLKTFFIEFLELFLPNVAAYVEPASVEFLDKELFADILGKEKSESDIVAKVKFRGSSIFFLLLCEPMSYAHSDFPARLLLYLALLYKEYGLMVYPIVVYSYDEPVRAEPDHLEFEFPDKTVLAFNYEVIQLNRLNWKDFVNTMNPVASALMSKMRIAPEDRVRVKAACMRTMLELDLDMEKMALVTGFVHTYLRLNPTEKREFKRVTAELGLPLKEKTMVLSNDWIEEGEERGTLNEAVRLTLRQLTRKIGSISETLEGQIRRLSLENIEKLSDALLDFSLPGDLDNWLKENANFE